MKKKILCLIIIISIFIISGCTNTNEENLLGINFDIDGNTSSEFNYDTDNPTVALKISGYGAIVIELYPNIAPNTVNNFIYLVKEGFYDNNTFHRLVPGFVLQGGDPTGTGSGGPGYYIKGEFSKNGFKNTLKHTTYVVSMARADGMDTAGSQFFIMLNDYDELDGLYAAFGKVIAGMDIIKKIETNETVANNNTGKLARNLVIKKALVNTKGIEYKEPEKIKE